MGGSTSPLSEARVSVVRRVAALALQPRRLWGGRCGRLSMVVLSMPGRAFPAALSSGRA